MARIEHMLINPCGTASPPRYELASRKEIPKTSLLGILNNGKTNAGLILDQIAEDLVQRFGFSGTLRIRKPATSHPCPDEKLKELTCRCAVVINGVGD